MTGLTCGQVSFGTTTPIQLHGKGRKERIVPLWPQTAKVLNRRFQQAVTRASATCPDLGRKRVTPHVIRHATAMHLLQACVDIAVIALWLGRESIETTYGYVEADLEMKERALEKLTAPTGSVGFDRN